MKTEVQNAVREHLAQTLDNSMMRRLTFEMAARRFLDEHVTVGDIRQLVEEEVNALVASIRARCTLEVNVMTSTAGGSLPTRGAQHA